MAELDLAELPDLLPLRDADGRPVGVFSDHGSWLGIASGSPQGVIRVLDGLSGRSYPLALDPPAIRAVQYPDRTEVETREGTATIGFLDAERILIAGVRGVETELPWRRVEGGVIAGRTAGGDHRADVLDANREAWRARLDRAIALARPRSERDRRLVLRAATTLLWNRRAPAGDLTHQGVIPSPFAYPGFWAWDSWKHARALARLDPTLAADQLRAQFSRQREDGMVPDVVYPDGEKDNFRNTKPAMAARALDALFRATGDESLVRELFGPCARQMAFFDASRRLPGEVLHRPGGVDHETATWDTGWDLSARYEGLPMVPHGPWRLLDVHPADVNAWHLLELRALEALAPIAGRDPSPFRRRAEAQRDALVRLFDPRLGAFGDARPAGGSTGVLSAAACVPAYAGAASRDQLDAVRRTLADPTRFATPLPFPALAASEPAFHPDGYWNGSVWLDHAAVAVLVLGDRGRELRERLLDGIARQASLFECYSPLSGQPARGERPAAPQFSWSACAVIELLAQPS